MNYEISGLISFKMYRKEFLYINVLYPRLIFLTKGRSTSSLYFSLSFAFNRLSFRRAFIVVSALHEQVVEHKSYMYTTDGNECSSFSFFFIFSSFLSRFPSSFSPSLILFLSFSMYTSSSTNSFLGCQGIGFDRGFERNDEILRILREGFSKCIHWQ